MSHLTLPDQTSRRRSTGRSGYLAAAWAGLYAALATLWIVNDDFYPFGDNDLGGDTSPLSQLPPTAGAPLFAGVLLVTAVAALAMAGPHAVRLDGLPRALLLGFVTAVSAVLMLVVPGVGSLALAGYAPMLLLGAPFGWPEVDYSEVFTWTLANQWFCVLGGVLLVRAAVSWQRRTSSACVACGRGEGPEGLTSPHSAARWGRWAVAVAVVPPLAYAVTRFAWVAGISLGLSEEMTAEMRASGAPWAGAGLGAFAVVGAVLTLGLVQRWGEVFPRWMVGLAGRRVPVMLAVVPAGLVAVLVTSAAIGFLSTARFFEVIQEDWAAVAPMLLWPIWGVALGLAALAYYLRRRGACATCGRESGRQNSVR